MKFEISRQIFVKSSNTKFHENPSSGNQVVPCGRTDRHYGANSRFPKFCERAQKIGGAGGGEVGWASQGSFMRRGVNRQAD